MSLASSENRVLGFLETNDGEFPAKIIARSLNMERSAVNRILYEKLLKSGKVVCTNSMPPRWSAKLSEEKKTETESDESEPKNVIFVDLGNIHDILQKLENYAHDCEVYAFADQAFNGYGVNPAPKSPKIQVFQSTDEHKNAADIEMIWKAAEIVMNIEEDKIDRGIRFIIFTRDNGFRSLKGILERYQAVKEVLFVQTWQQAREFIE